MSEPLDRERYVRKMSDRLHDRFLERPAFLDLDFIRAEVKKLDSQIDAWMTDGQSWSTISSRLGDPSEYADALFASRLLSPSVHAPRTSVLGIVLKILLVVAPVNFIFAIGPLLVGLVLLFAGWVISLCGVIAPLVLGGHFVIAGGVHAADYLFLLAVASLGALAALLMLIVSRLMVWAVWTWLGWNIAFLRAEPRK